MDRGVLSLFLPESRNGAVYGGSYGNVVPLVRILLCSLGMLSSLLLSLMIAWGVLIKWVCQPCSVFLPLDPSMPKADSDVTDVLYIVPAKPGMMGSTCAS